MTAIRELGPVEVSDQSQRVGTALVEQGEYLLTLGQNLLRQAAMLRGSPDPTSRPTGPSANHSVTSAGLIDLARVQRVARDFKRFTRSQFGEALGLRGVQTSKWLAALLEAGWITRTIDEETNATVFDYVRRLEDEDPLYQVRLWAQGVGVAFTAEDAIEQTGLAEEEVTAALPPLVKEGVLQTETVEKVGQLGDVDRLGEIAYRYAPPLPPGTASRLERERMAEINRQAIDVQRGIQVRTAPRSKSRHQAQRTDAKRTRDRRRENGKIQEAAKRRRKS